ncbi:Arc family DNA-binding protein [Rhizobium ruizarguesonis]
MDENQKELLANIAPFGLRMQADLKERIKKEAEQNNRSMNAEIVARLEASFEPRSSLNLDDDELLALAARLADMLVKGRGARTPASKSFLGSVTDDEEQ